MGRRTEKLRHGSATKSHTLPSSPTHSFSSSSSSSDFEFIISRSPHKSSAAAADELFYKGQILPLHLSPRISMVRALLLSSPSTSSSSDTTTTASRDSTASTSSASSIDLPHHLDCESSRPSSVTDDDDFKRLTHTGRNIHSLNFLPTKSSKYFSLAKFSSVFRKEHKNTTAATAVKRVSSSAKEVVRKYLKKVKPLYEKISQKQQQQKASPSPPCMPPPSRLPKSENTTPRMAENKDQDLTTCNTKNISQYSFSGSLRFPSRRSCISSCPSSMGSSPSHGKSGSGFSQMGRAGSGMCYSDSSSMEELQSAIQGAIAHCKNSMLQNKTMVSNEI
ncbi:probable membrane-associated kinase regulator 1 [Henckelia pumila]|uniref:probable membrane-associated kinase regulator 1 n=1 Tax=Henckelia pumila TaxID=405737 RepID=UPI003C6EA182